MDNKPRCIDALIPLLKVKRSYYLGDGAYALWDGYQMWIAADREDGAHYVALERGALEELNQFFKICSTEQRRKENTGDDTL